MLANVGQYVGNHVGNDVVRCQVVLVKISHRPMSVPMSASCINLPRISTSADVGADVSFDLLAKFGRYEAANIRVVGEL